MAKGLKAWDPLGWKEGFAAFWQFKWVLVLCGGALHISGCLWLLIFSHLKVESCFSFPRFLSGVSFYFLFVGDFLEGGEFFISFSTTYAQGSFLTALRDHSWWTSGLCVWYWGANKVWPCARQTPSWLCYVSADVSNWQTYGYHEKDHSHVQCS